MHLIVVRMQRNFAVSVSNDNFKTRQLLAIIEYKDRKENKSDEILVKFLKNRKWYWGAVMTCVRDCILNNREENTELVYSVVWNYCEWSVFYVKGYGC